MTSRSSDAPAANTRMGLVDRVRLAEAEMRDRRRRWQYRVHRGRLCFDRELREAQPRLRQGMTAYLVQGSVLSLLTAPVIYSLLLPLVLLDVWVMLYQLACFPIYGIARVPRRRYFAFDRHKLAYLNGIERVNCTFCSYANGLIAYVREVAARTEQYWCPIKHARTIPVPHSRYHLFFDYGDAEHYRRDGRGLRDALRPALKLRVDAVGQKETTMTLRLSADRRPENCRWSAPASWPDPMSDRDDDFKTFWTCERVGAAVTADDCRHCPCWSPERGYRAAGSHRRG